MSSPVPQLFERARTGDPAALNELFAALYHELRRIAALHLRKERPGHTLQTTALVHEAYLRLFRNVPSRLTDRIHFLALASRVMRRVLVDYGRGRARKKRGGRAEAQLQRFERTTSADVEGHDGVEQFELLQLDRALEALAREDKSLAQLIEMRYFGGMTAEETALELDRSVHVVRHDLRLAEAWLRRELIR